MASRALTEMSHVNALIPTQIHSVARSAKPARRSARGKGRPICGRAAGDELDRGRWHDVGPGRQPAAVVHGIPQVAYSDWTGISHRQREVLRLAGIQLQLQADRSIGISKARAAGPQPALHRLAPAEPRDRRRIAAYRPDAVPAEAQIPDQPAEQALGVGSAIHAAACIPDLIGARAEAVEQGRRRAERHAADDQRDRDLDEREACTPVPHRSSSAR